MHKEAPRIESPTDVRDTRIESPDTNSSPVINGGLESNDLGGMIEQDQPANAFEQEQTAGELGMTFEQEQTADELLADIQNAVDEMLQDFQTSPIAVNPPPVAPKKKRDLPPQKKIPPSAQNDTPTPTKTKPSTEYIVHMKSKNGGFGFQIMGGVDSDLEAQVDYIVPGTKYPFQRETRMLLSCANVQAAARLLTLGFTKETGPNIHLVCTGGCLMY